MERPVRVLVVDDEAINRMVLADMLDAMGHTAEEACDGFEALAKLKLGPDAVLVDLMMPGMDGFEVTRRIRQDPQGALIPIIVVTGLAGREDRLRAVEAGASDFIAKPVDTTELRVRLSSLLKMKEAQDALRRYQAELEETVERRTAALREALAEMSEAHRKAHAAYTFTVQRMALISEYKDEGTGAHIRRMGEFCAVLGRGLHLPPGEVEMLRLAGPMHDVGKMGIPDRVLLKPGELDPDEWAIMKQHTIFGHRILQGSASELLEAGALIALSHHERWDGSGYPSGLAGEEIPLWGRVCAVADCFDALTMARPYKPAYSNEFSRDEVARSAGSHLDARVVDVFLTQFDAIVDAQRRFAE
ncbi:MAG: response regulator [Armatimonadetes bacterium]|nr:response regulator [Armatimonadota bacterium]